MPKNKGLGRGLDAIFLDNAPDDSSTSGSGGAARLPISQIDVKADQPRRRFDPDTLTGLAESIKQNGVLQPILVREKNGRYEIIAGERRFRASKLAGLHEIPALILDADNLAAAKYALIENLQREDLNPYEEAQAYSALIDKYSLTQDEVAVEVGKSRSAVTNSLRLLELPDVVAELLIDGSLSAGHARTILGLHDKSAMETLANRCIERELSVRETEAAVRMMNREFDSAGNNGEEDAAEEPRVDYVHSLESRFTKFTGRRCKIVSTKKGKTFQIEYRDNEDLETIIKKIAGDGIFDEY